MAVSPSVASTLAHIKHKILVCCCQLFIWSAFSLTYMRYHALKVSCFWSSQYRRMVLGLATVFQDTNNPVRILCGRGKNFQKIRNAHVIRTRECHQNSARSQHLQSAQVEFFVSTQRRGKVAA